jgi:hypothetical protein
LRSKQRREKSRLWVSELLDHVEPYPLLLPDLDEECPEVTVLIPAMNEGIAVAETVRWCLEGLKVAGVAGEVLIVDSSTDDTAELAQRAGARVLRVPALGLGFAYTESLNYVRGDFVIMGDADCTYDFRALHYFVDAWRQGSEFVMGSRWKGSIEKGAMPLSHRYFGTPVTTFLLNSIYRTNFSDIHCGMRGASIVALREINMTSTSWQYASEMIIRAVRIHLPTSEVPVQFKKDPPGRQSHLKRIGWWAPWYAGWLTIRVILSLGADYVLIRPGAILFLVTFCFAALLALGPVEIGPLVFTLNWMFLTIVLACVGTQLILTGLVSRVLLADRHDWGRAVAFLARFDWVMVLTVATGTFGVIAALPLFVDWASHNYRLAEGADLINHLALFGLLLLLTSVQVAASALLLQAALILRR